MVGLPRNEKQAYRLISRPQMWPLPGFDLGHDLDPEFSRSNMELAISLPKMVRLPQNEKQTHRLNSWPLKWPSDLTLAVTLTLNFQGEIWIFIYLNQNWPDCHETKSKHIDLNSRPQIWPMGLTLAMTLIFEFWRSYVILTIWWPRSGVGIYQIVTGVTSDVGVPSTHLVWKLLSSFYSLYKLKEALMSLSHYPIDSNWVTTTL